MMIYYTPHVTDSHVATLITGNKKKENIFASFGMTYQDWICVFARHPFLSCQSRRISDCVWIEVILKQLGFSRHCERDHFAKPFGVQFIKSSNLVLIHIQSALGHPSHTSLWIRTSQHVNIVHIRLFFGDFEIANSAIALDSRGNVIFIVNE